MKAVRLPQSIKWRLLWWMAFWLSLILIGLGAAICELRHADHTRQLDEELRRRVAVLGRCCLRHRDTA